MSNKRKHIVVSLEEKLEGLRKLDCGWSMAEVAAEYGVSKVTVSDWKKKRQKLEDWCANKASCSGERKSMKKGNYEKVSEAVFVWFMQQRKWGAPVSGPLLQVQARTFYNYMKTDDDEGFTASTGWLDRWKKRYRVYLKSCDEKPSTDPVCVRAFTEKIDKIVKDENLSPHQVYNCDETALNFKMLPSSTSPYKEDELAGFQYSKERVTVLACSNSTGIHKLRLMLVGKSDKCRTFSNEYLVPVYYKNQKNALMFSELFREWFLHEFVPSVEIFLQEKGLPRRALLLVDNSPSHCSEEELQSGDIKVKFFPAVVTSLIQPMEGGVIEDLKRKYKRQLLELILDNIDNGFTVLESLEKIQIRDVIYQIATAWDDVQISTIKKSWRKLFSDGTDFDPGVDEVNADEELLEVMTSIPGCENVTPGELVDWINADDEENFLSDAEIIIEVNRAADDLMEDEARECVKESN